METQKVARSQIINQISGSFHGDLAQYQPIIGPACTADPEFLAHLLAWDAVNGQIKDTKVAFPVLTVSNIGYPEVLIENSLAHFLMLPPREMLRGLKFAIATGGKARRQRAIEKSIRLYLAHKEKNVGNWHRLAVRHRRALKELYVRTHTKPAEWAADILFRGQYPHGSVFEAIANLNRMSPSEVATTVERWKLPSLVVQGALRGSKARESAEVAEATVNQMTGVEAITKVAALEKKGLMKSAGVKAAVRKKMAKTIKDGKATLKTTTAADAVEDEGLRDMLREVQERQIQAVKESGRGIEGNWLVVSDCSDSQEVAIGMGVEVAAAIAKFVTGKVWLLFCNHDVVKAVNATGRTLESLRDEAKLIIAAGATSYGVALEWIMARKETVDGIAIVGDGGENRNEMVYQLGQYQTRHGETPAVYLYQTYCPPRFVGMSSPQLFVRSMGSRPFTVFDLTHGQVDKYSLPNLVQSMNVNRFEVADKIMATSLLTVDEVLGMM